MAVGLDQSGNCCRRIAVVETHHHCQVPPARYLQESWTNIGRNLFRTVTGKWRRV
jgi:hypothetical protein